MWLLLLLMVFSNGINSEPSIEDCGVDAGCFIYPEDCAEGECEYLIKWYDNKESTNFEVNTKISGTINNRWLGIGFSNDEFMGDDCMVTCRISTQYGNAVEHRYAEVQDTPGLLDDAQPEIGLSNIEVTTADGFLTCKFTRVKKLDSVKNYFDLNKKYHILSAWGRTGLQNNQPILSQHPANGRIASSDLIDFSSSDIVQGVAKRTLTQVHACIMIFLWMFCASTGIIIARYYKYIFPTKEIMKLKIWFVIHRPLMIFVPIISAVAFILVFGDLNWKWVSSESKIGFAHSIVGMITICLSLVQIVIGMLRCDKDHPNRPFFNFIHRYVGMLSYILANAALYLGVSVEYLSLGNLGWILILVWDIWLCCFMTLIEILEIQFKKSQTIHYNKNNKVSAEPSQVKNDTDKTEQLNKIKSIMLVCHLIFAFGLSIAVMVMVFKPPKLEN